MLVLCRLIYDKKRIVKRIKKIDQNIYFFLDLTLKTTERDLNVTNYLFTKTCQN